MDISTTYLGLTLKNPLVPSASPLSENVDTIKKMEDAGAGAVVMYSLFEEQIINVSEHLDHFLSYGTESFPESLDFFPDLGEYNTGPDGYLELIRKAKEAVDIPIIGSLNGVSTGGWVEYGQKIEEAGADALELNIYYIPTAIDLSGAEIEQMYLDVLKDVKKNLSIPLAVKIGPYFSSIPHMAKQLADAGADGLVLFNRFYQPDLNLETLLTESKVSLSSSADLRLPLRWVAILHGRVEVDFAITGGVHTAADVLKGLMAGAKVTMMASELLANGIGRITEIEKEMIAWLEEKEYLSVKQMQGSMSQKNVHDPAVFERANYMKILKSWEFDPTGQSFRK